ncbi:MAG TPA: polysaccharide deacetylase family protein [Cryomorphaceae bacterium]|nr:polysaccharide deacetylase family protein [Cryomorphaceae bacterium]
MITILTDFQSPRLKYAVDTIFREWLNLDYDIVTSVNQVDHESCCIVYGNYSHKGSINIFKEGLLDESDLRKDLPAVTSHQDLPIIFEVKHVEDFDLPFDVFSAVFFCLTRYEEYIITKRDEHGRFQAADSIFNEHNRVPYVDRWILSLENLIRMKLPQWKNPRSLNWLSTLDMDIAFAYKGRSLMRKVGATGKDLVNLRFDRLRERVSVLTGGSVDPFDTYDLFLRNDGADQKRIFIPVGDRGRFDNNLDVENTFLKQHINKLQKRVKIGLHPSYHSLDKEEVVEKEKFKLEETTGSKITESRQHFLRFSLPESFQILASLGIEKDYSMGFHDEVGFRSGTAYNHYLYDLINEVTLSIALIPLTAMDSAMKNYLNATAEESITVMKEILQAMQNTGGVFTSVWHNHSLSESDDWIAWRTVFQSIPDIVRSQR